MSDHYYTQQPGSTSDIQIINTDIAGLELKFKTDSGVFSKKRVDFGSTLLIETFLEEVDLDDGTILELGSGYGPIVIAAAKANPNAKVIGVELNERAYQLAQENAELNQTQSIIWHNTDAVSFDPAEKVNYVLTNPPIRAGKQIIQQFVANAYNLLEEEGSLWLVIQKKQGAPSMVKYMNEIFGNVHKAKQSKGYWILMSKK